MNKKKRQSSLFRFQFLFTSRIYGTAYRSVTQCIYCNMSLNILLHGSQTLSLSFNSNSAIFAAVHNSIQYYITITRLFKYTENFTTKKGKFSDKNSDILHISAQNIDCGYSLEPPRRRGSNEYPQSMFIAKTRLYNTDPLKPHFYIVKRGLTGVYIIFLISAQNIDCWYPLEPPRWGGSNEYLQSVFWAGTWNISEICIWKFSVFGGEIFYIFEYACFRNVWAEIRKIMYTSVNPSFPI